MKLNAFQIIKIRADKEHKVDQEEKEDYKVNDRLINHKIA